MDMSKLSKSNMENIVKEIRSHSGIKHQNIIELLDHLKEGNIVYLLLSLAENGNLFTYMNKVDISHAAACRIFVQMCLAIEHIHSIGYIHRDIKPENIFLDKDMNALLGDFGWCSHVADASYRYQKAGTYEYMSPEALNGKLQGREVDIWALGILLYELFHNQEPFPGRSSTEVLGSIQKKAVEFFSDVPKEAKDLIVKILVIDPKKRPTIREILSHDFVKKYYHDPLPAAPSGVENFPQSPSSSRNSSPLKNRIGEGIPSGSGTFKLGTGFSETAKAVIRQPTTLSFNKNTGSVVASESNRIITSPRQDLPDNRTPLKLMERQNTMESFKSPLTITSHRLITDTPQAKDPRMNPSVYSMRDFNTPLISDDKMKGFNPNSVQIRPKLTLPIGEGSYRQSNDHPSPLQNNLASISLQKKEVDLPMFPIPGEQTTERTKQITNQNTGCRPSTESRGVPHQYTPAISFNNLDYTSPSNVQQSGTSPIIGFPNYRFQFDSPQNQTQNIQSVSNQIGTIATHQTVTSPRIVIGSHGSHSSPENRSGNTSYSPQNLNIRSGNQDSYQQKLGEIRLQGVQPAEKMGQTIRGSEYITMSSQNMSVGSNQGQALTIGQQYRPQIVSVNTNPVRKTLPITPSNYPMQPAQQAPLQAPLPTDKDSPKNNYPSITIASTSIKQEPKIEMAHQSHSLNSNQVGGGIRIEPSPKPISMGIRDYSSNFDSSMIKTQGSSSTDESRRIQIESKSFDMRNASYTNLTKPLAFEGSSRMSNGNPAQPLAKDEPHSMNVQADKKMFLKRRTSDGFMNSGSGSPSKDSNGYASPLRNMLRVNNGRSSGDRPEQVHQFFNNPANNQNENMGSPLLRPSPVKINSNNYPNGGYQSFFMKKIQSIDSNVSSESELPLVSFPQYSKHWASQNVDSPPSPDLAKAMTAVVITSNSVPRPAMNNTLTR